MHATITARRAATAALNDAHLWLDHRVIDQISEYLDEPALRYGLIHGTPVDATVWHTVITAVPDLIDLDEAECLAITRDIAAAAGVERDGRPAVRWWAMPSRGDDKLHLITSTVDNDCEPLSIDAERVQRTCREITARIHAQNEAPLAHMGLADLDHQSVVIRDDPESGVAHTLGADELAELVLRRSGFRPADLGSGLQAWRTPYGATADDRAHIASTAMDLLSAVGYRVDIHTSLLTRPTPDHDTASAERAITDLTEQLRYSADPDTTAEITAKASAALGHLKAFTRDLGTWAEELLGDTEYTAELAKAEELLDQVATVINRDPSQAPNPRPAHTVTRAAITRTTARPSATITPPGPRPARPDSPGPARPAR